MREALCVKNVRGGGFRSVRSRSGEFARRNALARAHAGVYRVTRITGNDEMRLVHTAEAGYSTRPGEIQERG